MRLSRIFKHLKLFFWRKDGASGIEYAIVAAMVAVALTAFITPISGGVTAVMDKVKAAIPAASAPSNPSSP